MNAITNPNDSATPSNRHHLDPLKTFLSEKDYSAHAIARIVAHVETCDHLEACPNLEPEDRAGAYARLEAGYGVVPQTSHTWGSPEGQESPRNPLDDTWNTTDDAWYADACEFIHQVAMGTGPEEPPYEPDDGDWAELAAWSASLVGEGMEFPREMTAQERIESAHEIVRYWIEHPD